MAPADFTCVCGEVLPHQSAQSDFKCPHCGRVYNYQGRFLWQESAGNDLPGSSDIIDGAGIGKRLEDKVPDPEAPQKALEQAFEEGKLPDEPRRKTDAELQQEADEAEDRVITLLQEDRNRRGDSNRGR